MTPDEREAYNGRRKFSQWAQEEFPGIDVSNVVPAAIWFATEFRTAYEKTLPAELTHPKHIRVWLNAQALAPVPEIALETPEPSLNLPAIEKQARKIHALANSAYAGDEAAQRQM